MNKLLKANSDIRLLYGKMIILLFTSHIIFTCIFSFLQIPILILYNVFSCFFYVFVYFLAHNNSFRIVITIVHIEISLYASLCCIILGWHLGFPIYLIALTTLVYFCPFKQKNIPYIFSFTEILIFLILKAYCTTNPPIIEVSKSTVIHLYVFNSVCCFAIMLYSFFISKVSATTMEETLTQDNSRLKDMVDHDALTHLWSRPYFMDNFYEAIDISNQIILVMADIDDFKKINDSYGHECGDFILSELSNIIQSMCPKKSGICRWGGEEFIIMFRDQDLSIISPLIEQIRVSIEEYSFIYQEQLLHVTMTFGISSTFESRSLQDLIRLADDRLYLGKRDGKNKVIVP